MKNYLLKSIYITLVFIGFSGLTTIQAQSCYGLSLSKSELNFSLSGGYQTTTISLPSGCYSPTISVGNVPTWLTVNISNYTIQVTCQSFSSGYREISIPVKANGSYVNGFKVKQGTEPTSPPASCSITGFSGGNFDRLGETKNFPLTFSDCSASSAYFNFRTYDNQPVPSWINISQTGTSISVTCDPNTTSATRGTTILGTTTIGGQSVTIGSQITQYAYNNTVKHGLANDNLVYTRKPRVRTQDISELGDDEMIENVSYFDGLGRPKQNISIRAGGNHEDIITPIVYDNLGRQSLEYLPYATSTNGGKIFNDPISGVEGFYNSQKYENTLNPYTETYFESSPLNRVKEKGAPGAAWVVNKSSNTDHTEKYEYKVNDLQEVRLFEVDFVNNNTQLPSLVQGSYYSPGELYKKVVKNENWTSGKNNTVEEFANLLGQTVLKRTYTSTDINNDGILESEVKHDTYYVYDVYGNLTYMIPPKVNTADGISQTELNELCYQYRYDEKNRIIAKKIPGKGDSNNWEEIVYNGNDQPILTRDPKLKEENKWLFTLYDAFGRVAYTGIDSGNSTSRSVLQSAADATTKQVVTKSNTAQTYANTTVYYSKDAYPRSFDEVHTINYYDDYTFDRAGLSVPTGSIFGQVIAANVKGLATGTKVRVLGVSSAKWITTITAYDTKGRAVYVASKNEYLNTINIVKTKYDFSGNILKTRTIHTKGSKTIVTVDAYEYDHQNRQKKHYQCVGDSSLSNNCPNSSIDDEKTITGAKSSTMNVVAGKSITLGNTFHFIAGSGKSFSAKIKHNGELIAQNHYDELGQLDYKKVGGKDNNELQIVNYTYNIRGWLKGVNNVDNIGNDLFAFQLHYNTPTHNSADALFNGNISQVNWKTQSDNSSKFWYIYHYDALNRITDGQFAGGGWWDRYSVSDISYDKNGNINTLTRRGHKVEDPVASNESHFGIMDKLTYSYNIGNKLLKVVDNVSIDQFGFKDDAVNTMADTANDYVYDANGNMTSDENKGITGIAYNHLNLPTRVEFGNDRIDYIYGADGTKQKKKVIKGGAVTKITDYLGNYVYENNELKQGTHSEGYFEPKSGGGYQYVYKYIDIWGNHRVTYADDNGDGVVGTSEIRREQNYYPFGLEHKGYNGGIYGVKNNLKTFQGQEFTEDLELNTHEWKYRYSDPTIGRFWQLDPLAQDYAYNSTYAFQENKIGMGRELEGAEILRNNTGWFKIELMFGANNNVSLRNNNVPSVFKNNYNQPLFSAASVGLNGSGLNNNTSEPTILPSNDLPNIPEWTMGGYDNVVSDELGYGYQIHNRNRTGGKIEGLLFLFNLYDTYDNKVPIWKAYDQLKSNLTGFDKAIGLVNNSSLNESVKFKFDVINFVYDGSLPIGDVNKYGIEMPSINQFEVLEAGMKILNDNGLSISKETYNLYQFYNKWYDYSDRNTIIKD
ncbi:DUF6443 domain-containing protein [Galbibacter sp. EGI 63066]|uniref:DUF6443 domain-containing protein n=1 Tax=Galbibacter sp. EGI 63066 TaxID=2993559 RepID=UPI00224921CC|nr:DUF6443 domain-containing protein [Galbibacter sp. EGI 63066]MCX2679345.1 DUF6443 domain-containing protein [Galbibacter sp. EGI 63066]